MKAEIIVPDNLKEINLKQYQKFVKLQADNEGTFFLQQKMIEIFCGIKGEDVLKFKYDDVDRVTTILNDMFDSKPELVKTFKLKGIEYGFIPNLSAISFGEYIDLDTYMGDWSNIEIAMNVLYRPIKQKQGDKYLIEDYTTEGKEILLDMPMDAVLSSVFFFLSFRTGLCNEYSQLFESGTGDTTSSRSGFGKKWGWYQSLYALAGSDITRFENITKLNLHECLLMLTFMKEKSELEASEMKKKFK